MQYYVEGRFDCETSYLQLLWSLEISNIYLCNLNDRVRMYRNTL